MTPETIDTSEAANIDNDNRRHYDVAARGESTSLMRSMLGVNPFCVHEDAQFSCTFTPLCWMHGGVAMSGCDSMLYSCCVSHTIARRQVSCLFTIGLNHASDPSSNPTTPKFLGKSNLLSISICRGFFYVMEKSIFKDVEKFLDFFQICNAQLISQVAKYGVLTS